MEPSTIPPEPHPFVTSTTSSKALGLLIGSALGDAIGLYTEFLPKTSCLIAYPTSTFTLHPTPTPFRDDTHRDKFTPGDWTDDTDQALLILLSFLHSFRSPSPSPSTPPKNLIVDEQDIAHRISTWLTHGLLPLAKPPLGIGQTIGRVVLDPGYLKDPVETATRVWVKGKQNLAANGSLMRSHPLAVISLLLGDGEGKEEEEKEVWEMAARVGRVTHVDPRCVVACVVHVALLRGLVMGRVRGEEGVDEVVEKVWEWRNGGEGRAYLNPTGVDGEEVVLDREEFERYCYAKGWEELELDDGMKMGYVYKCLGAGIMCLRLAMRREKASMLPLGSEVFEEVIIELVMQGGDADTNACVAGALVGAWVGYERLPAHWEKGVRNREWLLMKCRAVLFRVGLMAGEGGKWREWCERDGETEVDGGPDRGLLSKEDLDKRERDVVMGILLKQKGRREEAEKREREERRGTGLGKWFK